MKPKTHSKTHWPKIIKISFALFFALAITSYGLWQLRHVLSGPQIDLSSPTTTDILTAATTTQITGTATDIDWLYLNGRQIFTDTDGVFSEEILLHDGYNVIQLIGKDKFGRQTTEMIEFVINNQQQ